ncbi:MAG: DUF2855 family protein [Pseudohongiellaceae bacterium]
MLTSKKHQDWVQGLGLYDKTADYASLEEIDASIPTLIVDMSGNSKLLTGLDLHLGENLIYCLNVGLTHWSEGGKDSALAV